MIDEGQTTRVKQNVSPAKNLFTHFFSPYTLLKNFFTVHKLFVFDMFYILYLKDLMNNPSHSCGVVVV